MPSSSPTSVANNISKNDTSNYGNDNEEEYTVLPEGKNPYIALREANIARNEARLRELGLLGPSKSTIQNPRPTTVKSINKKKTNNRNRQQSEETPKIPTRRSSRLTSRPESYVVPDEPSMGRKSSKRKRSSSNDDEEYVGNNHDVLSDSKITETASQRTFPENSARSISIHVEELVVGKSGFLGQPMNATGKAIVMQESANLFSGPFSNISFNKYCGVQEWRNDAIFLWVNLSNRNEFVNDFFEDGRKVTWFGGKRMHDETNVIQKLIRVGKAAANQELDPSNGIVLWVRQELAEKRDSFGPYYCLGRLAYSSHEPGSSPLSFVWTLMDYDRLLTEKSEVVREILQIK